MVKDSSYRIKRFIKTSLIILLGNAMSAMSLSCFALPYNMVVSGVSGIARMLKESMGISITVSVAVINIAFFIIGALVLGKKFAASTAIGTFAYPFFLGVFQHIEVLQHLVDDPLHHRAATSMAKKHVVVHMLPLLSS